jgi:ribonuclease P protein component
VLQHLNSFKTLKGFGVFSQVIAKGSRVENKPLKAYIYKSGAEEFKVEIGVAVSRQIRTAVERNRLKRLLREAIRKEIGILNRVNSAYEIVVIYAGNREIAPKKVRFFSIENATKELFTKIVRDVR